MRLGANWIWMYCVIYQLEFPIHPWYNIFNRIKNEGCKVKGDETDNE